jgi:hypothetical protein
MFLSKNLTIRGGVSKGPLGDPYEDFEDFW